MSVNDYSGVGDTGYESYTPQVPLLKSPARLLAHLQQDKRDQQVKSQLLEAAQWILNSPEAIGFCRLTALCYDVPTKLQDGPQCGLVALWMASIGLLKTRTISTYEPDKKDQLQLLSSNDERKSHSSSLLGQEKFPSVEWIQNMAKAKHFSKRGEMFSSENLASLAKICFQTFLTECGIHDVLMTAYVIKENVYSILTSYEKMVEFFTNEHYHQVLLVPYDSDYDQRPCRRKGHKSHWCTISGIATFVSNSQLPHIKYIEQSNAFPSENNENKNTTPNDVQRVEFVDDSSKIVVISKEKILPNVHSEINNTLKHELFNKKEKQKKENNAAYSDEEDEPSFYLIAKQSKSKRLFLFEPCQLAASNRNLVEVYPEQSMVQSGFAADEQNRYVIPSGGLRAGLANQIVVLKLQA